jgi:Protein of unknown function (DUF2809)
MPVITMNNVSIDDDRGERWPPAIVRVWLCLAIITAGLALRRFGFGVGLPASMVKYGGSILWATMVFVLTSILAGALASIAGLRLSRWRIALISAVIAVSVELFRLVHSTWLDAFRLTLAGALLLGRIFSLWDMVAYGAGIILGMLLDRFAVAVFTKVTPRKA